MQNFTITKDATSQILPISIYDSSSTTGAKLTGLVFNSAGLTAYYNRSGAAGAAVAITLATATKGTWATGGFVAIDGTNMPGDYELHIPNAALATGTDTVMVQLKGATNMVPLNILISLTSGLVTLAAVTHTGAVIPTVSAVTGLTAANLDTTVSSRIATYTQPTGFLAATFPTGTVANTTNITAGTITTATSVTNRVTANTDQLNGSATSADRIQRSTIAITFGTVGAASTVTSIVTSALDPAAAAIDQYKGKIVSFASNTTTVNLRGQSTDITTNTATGVLTVTALTNSPVSGDTFVIT